ncbi:SusC/RagA family TonB-linked outer membrane protein [Pseudoflavitalea sp. G-6-1-2]|uniref:SusC/RagA family TonB-linked outer membrane protein n=1 Tax=Pseudoflavitalea sp. G-6-1-2 TaxID=2728841 RepID=UPI00146C5596|nr:SusC/RagA family TonB-linked outer membrane protein [Pseudoflavitalea sp. G-6-1-2]NML22248.1 SusC/RagA family TonB-linked outer membrane protein [Pseudoflavitalea sp. G-6-1-2]
MIASPTAKRIRLRVSQRICTFSLVALLSAGMLPGTAASLFAQSTQKVAVDNMNVEKLFATLEKLYNVRFFYSRTTINQTEKISIPSKERTLDEVLSYLEEKYQFAFKKSGTMIAVSKKSSGNEKDSNRNAAQEIRGRVGLSENDKIYYAGGITVYVEGEKNGAVTDEKGYFIIKTKKENAALVISLVGYETKRVEVNGNAFVSATLTPAATALSEVTVVSSGYQTLAKKNTTGAYGTITSKEIERRSSQSLDRILEGAVPGLTVYQGYQTVGGTRVQGIDMQVRGGSAIQSDRNSPLIIVDGFEVTRLPDNMNEVEKIDVLKDAAASSIWGSKAANGVIVITTKRGKDGKNSINYTTNLYFTQRPDYGALRRASSKDMTGWDLEAYNKGWLYADMYKGRASGYTPIYDAIFQFEDKLIDSATMLSKLDAIGNLSNRQQIRDLLLRTGMRQNHYLSLSGGGPKYRYMMSGSFDDDKSVYIGEKSQSVQLNTRNDYEVASWLRLRGDMNVSFDKDNAGAHMRSELYNIAPYQMILDNAGNYVYDYSRFNKVMNDSLMKNGYFDNGKNLLQDARLANDVTKSFGVRTRLGFELKLARGLTINNDFMYDRFQSSNRNLVDKNSSSNRIFINQFTAIDKGTKKITNLIPTGNYINQSEVATTNWSNRFQANYTNLFKGVHYINLYGGMEIKSTRRDGLISRKFGFDEEMLSWQNIPNAKQLVDGRIEWWDGNFMPTYDATTVEKFSNNENRFMSWFSTAAYTYDDRYTVTGSLRFDESNLFGSDAKYRRTPLYSIGGAWNIDKESFFHSHIINTLKLRGTFGLGGNVDNSGTPLLVASKTFQSTLNDFRLRQVSYNPKLRWERTETINLGVDLSMWNGRLQLALDAYRKRGYDLLGTFVIDPTNGFTSAKINAAAMTNQGIEAIITASIIDNKDFKWTSRLNFGYNKNKVTSNKVNDSRPEINRVSGSVPYVEGYARETLWSYKWAGLDDRGNPLTFNEKGEKSKVVDMSSLVASGSYRPRYSGGFSNTFNYKGWFANVFLVYNFGNVIRMEMPDGNPYTMSTSLNNQVGRRWMKPGDEAHTDIVGMMISYDDFYDGRERVAQRSTNSVISGDFIRLREIQLGYSLPSSLLKRTPFRSIQLIAQLNNVAMWKKNKNGIDPEFVDPVSGTPYLPPATIQTLTLRVEL